MRKRMMGKRRKMSKTYYFRQIVTCLLVYCILLAVPAQVVQANPDPPDGVGPSVGDYTATLGGSTLSGLNTTTIIAPNNGTVFDWENFDIGFGHTVDHIMAPTGAVLHRINVASRGDNGGLWGDGAATGINGNLSAPGYLFVVNPMGIVIGPQAYIQAQRFVASGLNITNFDEFVDPTNLDNPKVLQFEGYSDGTLGVVNNSDNINVAEAVALVGKTVVNNGTITSDSVVLAAGEKVYLAVTEGGSNLAVDVTDLSTTPPEEHTVHNNGTIAATDGNVLLAAGDIYSNAISGVDSLAAVANRNIALGGDFEAGEITLTADAGGVDDGYVYAGGINPLDALTSTTGDIEISASDISMIQLNNVDIDAAEDLLLNNNTTVSHGKTLKAGQDVILAEGKTMKGYGALTIEGDRDIILGGDVHAYGTLTLKADADTVDNESGATTGGKMWARSTLGTIYGNIDIYGNAILLDNHVNANQDLILNNDTIVKDTGDPGIKLKAGRDIILALDKTMDSEGMLTLEADNDIYLGGDTTAGTGGSGEIKITSDADDTDGGIIEAKGNIVAAGALSISGNVLLTGEDGINTHSNQKIEAQNAGSIIVNQSVGPTGVGLTEPYVHKTSDGDLSILAGSNISLYSHVTVDSGKLDITAGSTAGLYGNLKSSDDMTLISNNGGPGSPDYLRLHGNAESTGGTVSATGNGAGIYMYWESWGRNINAGEDILLNDNTDILYSDAILDAGRDVVLADGKSLTGNGSITVEAGRDISLRGLVEAGGAGNVSLTTTSGNVEVTDVRALDDQITINSAGAITEYGSDPEADLTADTLDLTANDGIVYMETAANTIFARTIDDTKTAANILLFNENSLPTSLTASTVGTNSNITFSQKGGGELTLTDVSTVDGNIDIFADSGDIAATLVNAGGSDWDYVSLYTYNSGDITVGSVTAADYVAMESAGSINDAEDDKTVDIVTPYLSWLVARDEIGGSPTAGKTNDTLGAIETDVDLLYAYSWGLGGEGGGGDIVIVETDDVELWDVVAEAGSIFLEATNGGMTHVIPGEGTYTIKAGASTLTMVQQKDLDLAGFYFENQENTDFMAEITDGGFIADDLVAENAADQWQSIQALATDNIVLQGSDPEEDIKIGLHEGFEPISHPFGGVVESSDGGVSIISENNTVRTADDTILDNVTITGTSNDELGIGVDLPYGPGKAAIVIMGAEDLILGEGTTLTASGWYDTTGAVDDREGVGFLDARDEIPEGYPRYEGGPFDAAIYLASTGGDVEVSSTVSITSYEMDGLPDGLPNGDLNGSSEGDYPDFPDLDPVASHVGAMIIDAFDSVTFGEAPGSPFEVSLENGEVGDRLEVVSRITEWLFQAEGRLPYPSYPYNGVGPFPSGYTYVLRGAGLENPAITDERAWVLVDPDNAPLDREAGEQAQRLTLGLEGCPVLIAAASAELGIPGETIEVSLANSYALNTDIQPCESCARLLNAAVILGDEDGSRMAAMNQVFNALAPADTPLTPEVIASIVTAFAGHVNDGTQYATAIEYIDAFVQYIAVLNSDMGSPVGDSVAYVMEKYGSGVTGTDNANLAAFVAARLESGEMFGN